MFTRNLPKGATGGERVLWGEEANIFWGGPRKGKIFFKGPKANATNFSWDPRGPVFFFGIGQQGGR